MKLLKGQIVEIKNHNSQGKEVVEGKATLVKQLNVDKNSEFWTVKFGDGFITDRWIPVDYNPLKDNL